MRTIFPAAEKIYDMKKIIILIVCVLSACFAAAQEPVPVLTLGTFHFDFLILVNRVQDIYLLAFGILHLIQIGKIEMKGT